VECYSAPITNRTSGDEITHADMKLQGSEAGEVEVSVSMAESALSLSETQFLNASQLTSPWRPKSQGRGAVGLGLEIEVGAG
jgi:hypothetical protein